MKNLEAEEGLPDKELQGKEVEVYKIFIDEMSENIKEVYLSLGLKSKFFVWEEYNSLILKQIGYLSRFIVAIDTGRVGFDGRIRYRSRLYIRSAMWYYAKLLKDEARQSRKTMARRVCEGCENELTTNWQPVIGFSFEAGITGIDCDCYPEFK
jgi:hypothetical protein